VEHIKNKASIFITNWTAHGKLLKAKIEVYYALFVVLFVDETQADASGCGIDKSVHFFQSLEKELGINLMNRLLVAYKENEEVKSNSLYSFEKKLASGELNSDTIVFNNLVQTKAEFETQWELPLKHSWHKKMLVKANS
jgi:hypothetical protein